MGEVMTVSISDSLPKPEIRSASWSISRPRHVPGTGPPSVSLGPTSQSAASIDHGKKSQPSLGIVSKTSPNKTTFQHRRAQLPWLDGNLSRRGSLPAAPGAFVDEDPGSPKQTRFSTQSMSNGSQTQSLKKSISVDLVGSSPSLGSEAVLRKANAIETAERRNKQLEEAVSNISSSKGLPADKIPERTSSRLPTRFVTLPPKKPSNPALPVIALARDLYAKDNSVLSDSEISLSENRKRALSEGINSSSKKPRLKVTIGLSHSDEDMSPDMSAEDHRSLISSESIGKPKSLDKETSNVYPVYDARKKSLCIQPLRPNKVVVASDEVSPTSQADRKRALSVQPIKMRMSKSSTELQKTEHTLRSSIAGLENLMQEALQLAKDGGAKVDQNRDHSPLDQAILAQHGGEAADPEMLAADSGPKVANKDSSDASSISSCSTCNSSRPSSRGRQSLYNPNGAQGARSHAESSVGKSPSSGGGVRTIWDEDWPYHRMQTQQNMLEPAAKDWAYPNDKTVPISKKIPPGKSNDGSGEVKSRAARTEPHPTRTAADPPESSSRQNIATRDEVRQHIKKYAEPPLPPRKSSLGNGSFKEMEQDSSSSPSPLEVGAEASPVPWKVAAENWGRDKYNEKDFAKEDPLKGRTHVTLKEGERFSLHHGHRRQPIARNWSSSRKRLTATIACLNTALVGALVGIYAGEVPAIQYTLADIHHHVILGNVCLYLGMAITTCLFWPLPLLHGRKPYTLVSLGLALCLQVPQALIVQQKRTTDQNYSGYMVGLLLSRTILGLALGFTHINSKSTLLDLYGASLQNEFPHGEVVIVDDIRRHGGGMGYWLGIWSFSFVGPLSIGFLIGADIISGLTVPWGFYTGMIVIAFALFLNVVTPETRRAPHRRTMQEVELPNESISRRVARGEIKMHVSGDGPKWWWEEVFAGVYLTIRMLAQTCFLVMALYLGWTYAQIVLVIVLLGNLLSAEYSFRPEFVGLGVLSIAIGALLAVPFSRANFYSRSRVQGPRTDSMTFQPRVTWTSHLLRRTLFMVALPVAGIAYTLASKGREVQYMAPVIFAGLIGCISNLAIAECNGIIMETFDTSDLQPGTNSRHRLQSLAPATKRRRTAYSSYPRVSAGLFAAQTLGFLLAAAATGVGGAVTRTVGAQKATAITAGMLMGFTLLLTCALWRYRAVQVIPNEIFGHYFGSSGGGRQKSEASIESDRSWRAVVIGNPSGKTRRMNWLELGSLSRWTEIRRLNRLLSRSTTQGLNPGWR